MNVLERESRNGRKNLKVEMLPTLKLEIKNNISDREKYLESTNKTGTNGTKRIDEESGNKNEMTKMKR